jgi:hypothetical protein
VRTLSSDYGARTVPGGTSRAAVSRAPDVVIDEAVLQLYPFSRHAALNQDRSSPLFRLAHFIGTYGYFGLSLARGRMSSPGSAQPSDSPLTLAPGAYKVSARSGTMPDFNRYA